MEITLTQRMKCLTTSREKEGKPARRYHNMAPLPGVRGMYPNRCICMYGMYIHVCTSL